jgi:hypothetical protein
MNEPVRWALRQPAVRKYLVLILATGILILWLSDIAAHNATPVRSISIAQLVSDAQQGKIARIAIQEANPQELQVIYKDDQIHRIAARLGPGEDIETHLSKAGVSSDTVIVFVEPTRTQWDMIVGSSLLCAVPLIIVVFSVFAKTMRAARKPE